MTRLTEDKIRLEVDKKILKLGDTELISINYLKNNPTYSEITLKCIKHNEIYTVKYRFLMRGGKQHCKKCIKETAGKIRWSSEEDEIRKLKEHLEKANSLGASLEFVGLSGEWKGRANTDILIKCNKHNTITKTKIEIVVRNDIWHCPKCMKELRSEVGRYTPKEARENLENKFPDCGIDFSKVEETYTNSDSEVTVRCLKHGEFRRIYNTLSTSDNPMCPECLLELQSATKYTEDQAICKIKDKIELKNNNGADLEFLGFLGGAWNGYETKLILKCNKHNHIWNTTSFKQFCGIDKLIGCSKCRIDTTAEARRYTPEQAYELIKDAQSKRTDGFSFNLDKVKYTYTSPYNNVTLVCEKHGEFEVTFQTLMKGKGICPECLKQTIFEKNSLDSDVLLERINNRIDELKLRGHTIQFLGFVETDTTKQTKRHLKLYCVEHNKYWETTTFDYFVNTSGALFCPDCVSTHGGATSEKEQCCINETHRYVPWSDMDTQFEISLDEETKSLIHHEEKIKVDIYIKSLNAIIEYNGEQHYKSIYYFNKDQYHKFIDQVNRDEFLKRYCKENNIKLLIIPYKDDKRIPEIIEKFIKEGIDITTKVEVKPLPPAIYQETCRSLIKLEDG